MHTGRFWDPGSKKHSSGDGPGHRAYSALPLDWDDDGDLDLVIGTDAGRLFLRVNEGSAEQHAFATVVVPIRAGDDAAAVPSGYAMPVAADWDGDGRWDLVSGAKDGSVHWFRNAGEGGEPRLEPPRQLLPAATGSQTDAPGPCAQVFVADYEGDGDLDLLVGDRHFAGGERHGWVWLYRREGAAVAEKAGSSR